MIIESRAFARAGLVGNPSDGYFGKTISVSIKNFGAHIQLFRTPELVFQPAEADLSTYKSIYHLRDQLALTGYAGGIPLLKATTKRFLEYADSTNQKLSNHVFTVRYHTSIPRQVGMAGSSAIVTAMLKALMQFYQVDIPLHILPTLALSVEADELGITAGLQDRVIQAYEGCVFMDFEKEHLQANGFGLYQPLPVANLPKMYIAYMLQLGKVSGKVLNEVRAKFEKGEPQTISTLQSIAGLAAQGRDAILAKDHAMLAQLINQNFDYRTQIMQISPSNQLMIDTARACGASASFTGSGGAIIGSYTTDRMLEHLFIALKGIGAKVVKPYFS